MHACGHDGHTAIGLAVAERLANPGRRVERHAEADLPARRGRRARRQADGRRPAFVDDVDYLFAGHLGCNLPSGKLAARATGFLFSRKIDVVFHGRAAHAAMGPHEGRNALLAAAAAALGLHGIARHAQEQTHVNVGKLVAGIGRNIIADRAEMMIEVRGASQGSLDYMTERAMQVLRGRRRDAGVTVETKLQGETIGAGAERRRGAHRRGGRRPASRASPSCVPEWSIGGGDDATFMLQRVQQRGGEAVYFILGSDTAGRAPRDRFRHRRSRARPWACGSSPAIADRVLGAEGMSVTRRNLALATLGLLGASGRGRRAIDGGARHRCRSADAQPGDVDRLRDGRCRREGDGRACSGSTAATRRSLRWRRNGSSRRTANRTGSRCGAA